MSGRRRAYKKGIRKHPRDKTTFSRTARRITENIQGRKYADALQEINGILHRGDIRQDERARLLALVGDGEFAKGRFQEAAQIYLQSATAGLNDARLWLRAYIGEVRALLKLVRINEALMIARHAVEIAAAKMAEFDQAVRAANQSIRDRHHAEVPPVPVRPSVAATRLGYAFLREGELDAAEELFNLAIQHAKKGANRARQGLAEIATLRQAPEEALQTAVDALWRGKFRVKTIPA